MAVEESKDCSLCNVDHGLNVVCPQQKVRELNPEVKCRFCNEVINQAARHLCDGVRAQYAKADEVKQ